MHNLKVALATIIFCALIISSLFSSQTSSANVAEKEDERLLRGSAVVSTEQHPSGNHLVKAKILIKASPDIVWSSVHQERKSDPDLAYSRILNQDREISTLEQKFVMLPIIATAICVMSNHEVPLQRIDYKLIKSNRFKAMEGSWILTPFDSGSSTILELSSYLDIGAPVPRILIDSITAKKLERRLTNVKIMSERIQVRLAHKLPS